MSTMDDPPDSSRPSASLIDFTLARSSLLLESHPSTVTWSPIFTVFRVQPARVKALGLPISSVHCFIWPLSSFALTCRYACGFVHSTLLTVPVSVTGFVQSYSAANG